MKRTIVKRRHNRILVASPSQATHLNLSRHLIVHFDVNDLKNILGIEQFRSLLVFVWPTKTDVTS